jgi:hypothetical protein
MFTRCETDMPLISKDHFALLQIYRAPSKHFSRRALKAPGSTRHCNSIDIIREYQARARRDRRQVSVIKQECVTRLGDPMVVDVVTT